MEKTEIMKVNAKNQERIAINGLHDTLIHGGQNVQRRWRSERSKEQTLERSSFVRLKTIWSSKNKKNKVETLKNVSSASIVVWLRNLENEQK